MAVPAPPPEALVRSDERQLGQWEYVVEMTGPPVARILERIVLTTHRLIVIQLPTPWGASNWMGRLALRRSTANFRGEMGRWHVLLDANLRELPEPALGRLQFARPSALSSNRVLFVGDRHFPVGESPLAEPMEIAVRTRWGEVRAQATGSGARPA